MIIIMVCQQGNGIELNNVALRLVLSRIIADVLHCVLHRTLARISEHNYQSQFKTSNAMRTESIKKESLHQAMHALLDMV